MIAPYVQAAAELPLGALPSRFFADCHALAERDRVALFAADAEQLADVDAAEPELAL